MSFTPSENPITNPTRESYTELRPFRFWCQKVLPLVYDDTLSYYELLCKVVDYLNKTMEDVDHMNTDMDTLYSNFQQFQEGTIRIYNELVAYVNAYFDELDVQEEINNKLDDMVTSGELVTILQPSIASEVSSWLSEHITPTTPAVDDTLTVSGAAADSKTVGDALNDINSELSELSADINDPTKSETIELSLIQGEFVRSTTGAIVSDSGYTRTDYIDVKDAASITLAWTQSVLNSLNAICFYDENQTFISGVASPLLDSETSKTHTIPTGTKYAIFSGFNNIMGKVRGELNGLETFYAKILKDTASAETVFGIKSVTDVTLLQRIKGVTRFPDNLIVPAKCVDNAYINYSTGTQIPNDSYFCTGFVPVTGGETYKANVGRNYAFYNADKTYVSGDYGTEIQASITAPNNASYIRFTINKESDGITNPYDLYFTSVSNYDDSVIIDKLAQTAWCNGKRINWIGDSIVDGQDFDEEVCTALNLIKQYEYGINGSTIALKADGTDGRNALCIRYSQMTNDADIIAVSCGTNDWMYAWCPVGTIESTENTTFYGALKTLCEGLINKYPQKVIFFTTPIKRAQPFDNGDGGEYTQDGVMTTPFSKNKYGKTLGDYADIIKEVCGYYSIPVLDMYRESLLNPHLASQQNMFDSVYTHPNTAGQKIMARRVAGWMTQLGYIIK